jgi:hypothetical protein
VKLNELIGTLSVKNGGHVIVGNNNKQDNSVHINIHINTNPITKLNLEHIEPLIMRTLIEKYDKDSSKLNLLLSEYMKNILCDEEHPENHSVTYIKRKPPTYNSMIENEEGKIVNAIKGLNDTCELLSDPMLDTLKCKIKECLKQARKDIEFDYDLYEDTIRGIKTELNKDVVKKALKSVLQNDILNDIRMRFEVNKKL